MKWLILFLPLLAAEDSAAVVVAGEASAAAPLTVQIGDQALQLRGLVAASPSGPCHRSSNPEHCAAASRQVLADLLYRETVICEIQDEATHAACRIGEHDLADLLIARGYALAHRGTARHAPPESGAESTLTLFQQANQQWQTFHTGWTRERQLRLGGALVLGLIVWILARGRLLTLPLRSARGIRWVAGLGAPGLALTSGWALHALSWPALAWGISATCALSAGTYLLIRGLELIGTGLSRVFRRRGPDQLKARVAAEMDSGMIDQDLYALALDKAAGAEPRARRVYAGLRAKRLDAQMRNADERIDFIATDD